MKTLLLFLFALFSVLSFGNTFIIPDTILEYPIEINKMVTDSIVTVRTIDLDGDGIKDYIINTSPNKEKWFDQTEFWVTSCFSLILKRKHWMGGYSFFRFVNLDDDPELEAYSAYGYEDGIDYSIFDLNLKKGKLNRLFYFNPVIVDNEKNYWGYPWDTEEVMIKFDNGQLKIYTSLDHDIVRDGNITIPKKQKIFPALFFKGTTTQPASKMKGMKNMKWYTLEEITKTV
jgi:hypothetical protein